MTYEEFRTRVSGWPLVSWPMLKMLMPVNQQLKVQLSRWRKKGKLIPLNRNLFLLQETDRKINPSRLYMACEMYPPCYTSLEYALGFYGLIPERVTDITCVTTKKTRRFSNAFGSFVYQHIKTEGFAGFTVQKDEAGLPFYIAEPEKALVDFIYLNLTQFQPGANSNKILEESFRLQSTETLNKKKLLTHAGLFGNQKLVGVIRGVRV